MSNRANWPALGYIKALEVTRGVTSDAHPHIHALLLVPCGYFGRDYVPQREWAARWKHALRADYEPRVDVRAVRPKPGQEARGIGGAVAETLKYAVKPADLVTDGAWLLTVSDQLTGSRAVSVGGVLRDYVRETEPEGDEELIGTEGEDATEEEANVFFGWAERIRRYRRAGPRPA
jgi:hypothetical protein